ncbi:MAG: SDR family oxidoreductase [Bacteroidetes bacterium]|nr:SDR family oxidoreductase [Bacteroidota bacterium]
MFNWKDKTVIITGASSGIGKAIASGLAGSGARLVLAARNVDELNKLAVNLRQKGNQVLVKQTDVSREDDCRSLISNTVNTFGSVHVLINNAGISMRALFEDVDLKVLHELMDVNFWGSVYCTKYALPYLLKEKGSVAGISSIAGNKGLPGRTGYSASKFALQGFLETLRIETRNKGLHVLIACPGFTSSNIRNTARSGDGSPQKESPLDENKLMPAETVARKIIQAIEIRKRMLVLTTQGKLTIWLNKFFPAFMDGMVYNHMAKEPDSPFK